MCDPCNNARSQPFDLAYDRYAEYASSHSRSSPSTTGPTGPQANGKIERFHRTLGDGLADTRF